MFIKSSTILASAVFALMQNPKAVQHRQWIFLVAVLTSLILYGWYREVCIHQLSGQPGNRTEDAMNSKAGPTVRWSYDEMAHKLIIENTDLTRAEISRGFTKGIGHALIKVTRQADGRPVILNM